MTDARLAAQAHTVESTLAGVPAPQYNVYEGINYHAPRTLTERLRIARRAHAELQKASACCCTKAPILCTRRPRSVLCGGCVRRKRWRHVAMQEQVLPEGRSRTLSLPTQAQPLSSTPIRMLVDPIDDRVDKALRAYPCKLLLVHNGIVSWESKPGLGEPAVEGLRHACLLIHRHSDSLRTGVAQPQGSGQELQS